MSRKAKKIVRACLHSSYAVQVSLQFDEFFLRKKKKNQNPIFARFEIYNNSFSSKTCWDTLQF